jgi:hypothetical protein
MIWRRIENFSTNAVCLVLASLPFLEEDYVRDHHLFLRLREAARKIASDEDNR